MSTEIKKEEKQKDSKGLLIILSAIILGLGGTSIYLYSALTGAETENTKNQQKGVEKDTEIDGLLSQLDEKEAEYTRIIQEKEELGYDVSDLQQERETLLEDIKNWRAQAKTAEKDVKALKALTKQLKLKDAQYTLELNDKNKQIDFLKGENDSLNTTTQELNQQKFVQATIIDAQNAKIQMGSVLNAENIKVVMKTEKQKTIEKQPFKGSKIDAIVLHFNIADNKVASYSKKTIAIRLVGPDGAVLYDLASGGGHLKTSDDETVFYTLKQNLLFDNTNQLMTFPYFKDSDWVEGNYAIQIYADGYTIGKTTFTIK